MLGDSSVIDYGAMVKITRRRNASFHEQMPVKTFTLSDDYREILLFFIPVPLKRTILLDELLRIDLFIRIYICPPVDEDGIAFETM